MTTRRRFIGLLVLGCAGCAKPDWIESTLVTVEVSGEWTGSCAATGGASFIELSLQQNGQKVTGESRYSGWNAGQFPNSKLAGTLSGDILRFRTRGQGFTLVVSEDEMRGTGGCGGHVEFRRRK
jgi:hypothetical protein